MGVFNSRAAATAAGRSTPPAAIAFMNPDSNPAASTVTAISRASLFPASRPIRRPIQCATPVFARPALITMTAPMVTTALLENPRKAASKSIAPPTNRTSSTAMAVTSNGTRPLAKATTATPTTASTNTISPVIRPPHAAWRRAGRSGGYSSSGSGSSSVSAPST